MTWTLKQLTFGSDAGRAHSHSYYDIPVADLAGQRVLVHELTFTERHPGPQDAVRVGWVDVDRPGEVRWLGTSRAWSWQQGPMAQWVGGGPKAVWNDREDGRLIARLVDVETGEARTLPQPVYAVAPDGRTALGLDMARLHHLRPGYGYPVSETDGGLARRPDDSGVWAMDLAAGPSPRLILPLNVAADWLIRRLPLRDRILHWRKRYHYWFNHAKISPDGTRFTVKLRWRRPGTHWGMGMGVSLTAAMDGSDLRLLRRATSHVIWQTADRLYMWCRGEWALVADTGPHGTRLRRLAEGVIDENVHLRQLPPGPDADPSAYVYDVRNGDEVDVRLYCPDADRSERLTTFTNHVPPTGPFRCDPHPVPASDGRRIFVTSLQDGARQLYCLERGPDT